MPHMLVSLIAGACLEWRGDTLMTCPCPASWHGLACACSSPVKQVSMDLGYMQGTSHAGRTVTAWQHLVRLEAKQHVHHHAGVVCPACCSGSQIQGRPPVG